MQVRKGLDPGDVVEFDINNIVDKIDDILHEEITKIIGYTVNHTDIYLFVMEIIKRHNEYEAEIDKLTKVFCPHCGGIVYWRVTIDFGFFCEGCGLVLKEPLDPLDYDEKATKENESERLGRLIYKFKGAKT